LICELDAEGRFMYVNSKYKELLGYEPEELIGHFIFEFRHPKMENESREEFEELLIDSDPVEDTWLFKTKSGSWRWFNCYFNTFTNSKGEPHVSLVSFDITEKKIADEQLQTYASELIKLNATKDKFFGIIAHDLKNPFSSLLGASEILANEAHQYDVNNIVQFCTLMNDAAKRGYALLENLLEWSRSQTDNLKCNPQKISIREMVAENLSNVKVLAANKKIKLHSVVNDDVYAVVDKNMLNTILRNLLNNALKFTHIGGEVTVNASLKNDNVMISVKDTGIGIKKEDIEKLFRIDIKYTNIGTAQERGTGLGLILCKEFVEKHGGEIWVESIPGKGSEFKFTIPLKISLVTV
jgi:two-component system, sensor histidine kinase and response regulator